ncbi:MAG TPA: hypothetical protein VKT33_14210 [Candidatus Angelobacter sp.]|nr:hypothetical protein [Candidatus Angelobacter sp.]
MKMKNTLLRGNEKGSALLVALFALLLLTAIGIGFMFMADTENSVNNNYRDSQKAYFAARAGLENVRLMLSPTGSLRGRAVALTPPSATSTGGIIYVLNPTGSETVDPSDTSSAYLDDELCQEQFGAGTGATFSPAFTLPPAGVHCGAPGISNSTPTTSAFVPVTPQPTDIPNISTASALPFKWVRITPKQNFMGLLAAASAASVASTSSTAFTVDPSKSYDNIVCFDGTNEVTIASNLQCEAQSPKLEPVWLVTALAVTPGIGANPGSRRIVQMELASPPPVIVNPQGTVSTEAPISFKGTSTSVSAIDYCTCNVNNCTTNHSGDTSCTAFPTTPATPCNTSHNTVYTANTISTSGNPTAISAFGNSLTGPASVQNVSPWPYNISSLITQYQNQSIPASFNSSCTGTPNFTSIPPVYSSCGTQSGQTFGTYPTQFPSTSPAAGLLDPSTAVPQVTYISGSVQLTANATGAGVLVVDGDLDIHGGLNFYGLILVRGTVTFTGGGSSGTNLNGAILAGQDVTNNGCPTGDTTCDTSDTVGGNVNLQYDSCALSRAATQTPVPPHLLATHEIQY